MSNLEHYFENLLFEGRDCNDDVNKNSLTKEEQEAVEACAAYVIYSLFDGRDEFKHFVKQLFEPVTYGVWVENMEYVGGLSCKVQRCSVCGKSKPMKIYNSEEYKFDYCPNCGSRMTEDN